MIKLVLGFLKGYVWGRFKLKDNRGETQKTLTR